MKVRKCLKIASTTTTTGVLQVVIYLRMNVVPAQVVTGCAKNVRI
jgi:hypothetical protein